jgi:rhodanese-related sulfurtransferase
MKSVKTLLLIVTLTLFTLAGCNAQDKQASADSSNSKDITVLQLKEQMQTNPDLVILDVRTKEELTGKLPKIESAINIPLQELQKRINELTPYKDKKIAVICRSGHRSSIAYGILKEHNYKVENVLGGMQAYLKK